MRNADIPFTKARTFVTHDFKIKPKHCVANLRIYKQQSKMRTIFFQNGVYVYSENFFDFEDDDNKAKTDVSIIVSVKSNFTDSRLLYGGRVRVYLESNHGSNLTIDGVDIKDFHYYESSNKTCAEFYVTDELPEQKVTAYLNQIEQLGIDTFLENYKTTLENFKADIMALCEKYESLLKEEEPNSESADTYKDFLNRARACLTILTIILFSLACNMKTGLDNHVYEDAYNEVLAEYDVVND